MKNCKGRTYASLVMGVFLLAGSALAVFGVSPAHAQGSTHEVRKGDTLSRIAGKVKYDGVTRNQMLVAIHGANPSAFKDGNINSLRIGTKLTIPAREEVVKTSAADASRKVRELVAAVRVPIPAAPTAAVRPTMELLAPAAATSRYEAGIDMERKGDLQGALTAFLQAGESGNGLAQKKLGEIYGKGNKVVRRDYQTSLLWYQKARAQGVEIEQPMQRAPRP